MDSWQEAHPSGTVGRMKSYYLSTALWPSRGGRRVPCTIQVDTDEQGIIRWTAAVAGKFVGQPLRNLVRWSGADVVEEIKREAGDCK